MAPKALLSLKLSPIVPKNVQLQPWQERINLAPEKRSKPVQFTVELAPDSTFSGPYHIRLQSPSLFEPQVNHKSYYCHNLRMLDNGEIKISDYRTIPPTATLLMAQVTIRSVDVVVTTNGTKDIHGEDLPNGGYQVVFQLKDGKHFQVAPAGMAYDKESKENLRNPNKGNPLERLSNELRTMYDREFLLSRFVGGVRAAEHCSWFRLTIHEQINNTQIGTFAGLEAVLSHGVPQDVDSNPNKWYEVHMQALAAEDQATGDSQAKIVKDLVGVTAKIEPLPEFADRFRLKLTLPAGKPIPVQSKIVITAVKNSKQALYIGADPGKTANPGVNDPIGWIGTCYMEDKQLYCTVDNLLTGIIDRIKVEIARPGGAQVAQDLQIAFINDITDDLISRQVLGLKTAAAIMRHEAGLPTEERDRYLCRPMNLVFCGWFLTKVGRRPQDQPKPLQLLTPWNTQKLCGEYEFVQQPHIRLLEHLIRGQLGRVVAEGPPATGKTTFTSKLIHLVATKVSLQNQHVLITAHTNEAVRVAITRTIDVYMSKGNKTPEQNICLLVSDSTRAYWKVVKNVQDPIVQKCLYHNQLRHLADKNRSKYGLVVRMEDSKEKYGRPQGFSKAEIQAGRVLMRELRYQLLSKVTTWFMTMSSIHLNSPFFDLEESKRFQPRVLFLDEASQATDAMLATVLVSADPYSVYCTGDAKQLPPYASTQVGRAANSPTRLEKLAQVSPSEQLTMQYRTHPSLYHGTTVHYPVQIESHPTTSNRGKYRHLMSNIPRISFCDASGSVVKLSSNFHVFNITNSTQQKAGDSWQNAMEVEFLDGFIKCLTEVSIPAKDIMALTAYQGQFDGFNNRDLRTTKCRKIDGSQGDESDIVAFSMVRTDSLGFMSQLPRQNVATSRARE